MPRILLVDDDIAEISAVKRVLTRAGHQPVLATNASDARTAIAHATPDLLLVGATCESGEALALARQLGDDGYAAVPMLVLGEAADAPASALQLARPIDPGLLGERVAALLAAAMRRAPAATETGAAAQVPAPVAARARRTATSTSPAPATATSPATPTATPNSTPTPTATPAAPRPAAKASPAAKRAAAPAAPAANGTPDAAAARRAAAEALRARAAELRKPDPSSAAAGPRPSPPPAEPRAPTEVELASDGLEALLRRAEEAERRHAAERKARARQADRATVEAAQRAEAERIAIERANAAREAEERARAETEARHRAEADRRAAEDAGRRDAGEEARRAEEAEARARAEGEARRRAEEERRLAEEERRDAEASARRGAEEEARRAHEAEARARAEAEARRSLEGELARLRGALDEERRAAETKLEQVLERAAAEEQAAEELRRLAEEEARSRAEQELRARDAEEEALRRAIESARSEMEALRRTGEEEARRRAEAEAEVVRVAEAEARRRAEVEAELRRVADEEARRRAELEAELRRVAEEAARRPPPPPAAFDFPGLGPLVDDADADAPAASAEPPPAEESARRRVSALRGAAEPAPPRADPVEDGEGRPLAPPPPELRSGTLADLPAPRVLALAARAALGGRIDVQGEGARSVYFEAGRVVGATSADPAERVEELALRLGLVTRDQHRQVAAAAASLSSRRAALLLLERGFLKPTELTGLVRRRTEEIVFGLFADAGARFRWAAAEVPPEERIALERGTLALAVEGVRRRWLAPRVDAVLGGPGTLLAPAAGGPAASDLGLSPDERRAVALADGLRTLDEVVCASPLDPLSTRQVLAALVLVGALSVRVLQAGRPSAQASAAIDLGRVREKHDQVRRADYFTILGVGRLCTPHEVREAAERLLAELDPARLQHVREEGLAERLEEIRRVVSDAREVLADDRLRVEYLSGLGGES